MPLLSTDEMLEECQASIIATMKLISSSMGDKSVQHERLSALQEYEQILLNRKAREDGSRPTMLGVTFNGL